MSGTGEPYGEERELPGPCFGRMREEEKMKALKPTCPGDDARGGTGVAMETASSERSDHYTSLLSSNSSSSNPFSAGVPLFSSKDDRSPPAPLGSDSGIGMTPGDPCDLHTQKSEPYNYMDMSDNRCDLGSRSNTGSKKQPIKSHMDRDDDDDDEDGTMDFKLKMEKEPFDLGSYLEKNPENLAVKGELGNTFPYVEDQSDDELLENRPRPVSPVKITVTTDTCILVTEQARGVVSERESVLSLGKEGVPTVTLSEPEDDSAASSVNHSPSHSPTGRESPSDILFQPVRMNNSALYQDTKVPMKPSSLFGMRDSGESGESEIEPDSPRREKQFSAKDRSGNPFEPSVTGVEMNRGNKGRSNNPFEASVNTKGEFVQHGNPPLYSLLREEREAELDSDLLIESASEESPKREQVMKCTLKPSSPLSSPPPVSSAVSPPRKEKEQEVREEKKEKPSAALREESNTQTQQQEDKMLTKGKPGVTASCERRPLEDGGNTTAVISTEEKRDAKEVELLPFLHHFNKQKGKERKDERFVVKKQEKRVRGGRGQFQL
ncbi:hypothetical protein AMELA_G00042880 [Ameiurus melas]|uniref:Uncharacterized protein n=1 Tax=Ameiurus melas TaxID=219545 RepID=A0A7J6B482_AMEME|nr:hypothetical protein AMELA_G00042880 [Ameiurus melas]